MRLFYFLLLYYCITVCNIILYNWTVLLYNCI